MKVEEAKELAAAVDKATMALNDAITTAAKAGLTIEACWLDVQQLAWGNVPLAQVNTKINPGKIDP